MSTLNLSCVKKKVTYVYNNDDRSECVFMKRTESSAGVYTYSLYWTSS